MFIHLKSTLLVQRMLMLPRSITTYSLDVATSVISNSLFSFSSSQSDVGRTATFMLGSAPSAGARELEAPNTTMNL